MFFEQRAGPEQKAEDIYNYKPKGKTLHGKIVKRNYEIDNWFVYLIGWDERAMQTPNF